MAERDLSGIATTAKIGSHPAHPMLIPFPIALLASAFVCDLVYAATSTPFWAEAAMWCLVGGIAGAVVAAAAGLIDFAGNAEIRRISDAWKHMIGNVVAVGLALVSLWLRYSSGAEQGSWPSGIILSGLIVLLLGYTGWKGGNLVYHHRVGMSPEAPADTRTGATRV